MGVKEDTAATPINSTRKGVEHNQEAAPNCGYNNKRGRTQLSLWGER